MIPTALCNGTHKRRGKQLGLWSSQHKTRDEDLLTATLIEVKSLDGHIFACIFGQGGTDGLNSVIVKHPYGDAQRKVEKGRRKCFQWMRIEGKGEKRKGM